MLQQSRKPVARLVKSVEHKQSTHAKDTFSMRHAAVTVFVDFTVGESCSQVTIVDGSSASLPIHFPPLCFDGLAENPLLHSRMSIRCSYTQHMQPPPTMVVTSMMRGEIRIWKVSKPERAKELPRLVAAA